MVHKALGNHIFLFLLDLLEENANLGENHVGGVEAVRPILDFRILLSRDLINNYYLRQDDLTSE